jgi:hypothetical protein
MQAKSRNILNNILRVFRVLCGCNCIGRDQRVHGFARVADTLVEYGSRGHSALTSTIRKVQGA